MSSIYITEAAHLPLKTVSEFFSRTYLSWLYANWRVENYLGGAFLIFTRRPEKWHIFWRFPLVFRRNLTFLSWKTRFFWIDTKITILILFEGKILFTLCLETDFLFEFCLDSSYKNLLWRVENYLHEKL